MDKETKKAIEKIKDSIKKEYPKTELFIQSILKFGSRSEKKNSKRSLRDYNHARAQINGLLIAVMVANYALNENKKAGKKYKKYLGLIQKELK